MHCTYIWCYSRSSCGVFPLPGKRRRAAGTSRSSSVKRETTPVPKTAATIGHNQKQSKTTAKKHSSPAASKRGRSSSTSNDDLGCNEEIAVDDEDDDDEEEAECSATQCLQPVTDQIIWVQCDHCQEWFHCICVGLTKEYAEQIDTYKCASCKDAAATGTPATSTVSVSTSSHPVYSLKVGTLLSAFSSSLPTGQT